MWPIPHVRFRTRRQARVVPAGFSFVYDAESFVGFMTAELGGDSADGQKKSSAHLALLKDIELKIDELKEVEKRLGSPAELPADLDRARDLAHRINNLLTTCLLGGDASDSGSDI